MRFSTRNRGEILAICEARQEMSRKERAIETKQTAAEEFYRNEFLTNLPLILVTLFIMATY